MTGAPDEGRRPERRGEKLLLGLARLILIFEDLWPRVVPVLSVIALFVAVALFDVLPLLADWLHTVLLLGFGLMAVIALGRIPAGTPISDAAVRRRVERDSNLAGHPLETLNDTLAGEGTTPTQRALWRLHRQRAERASRHLKVGLPAPGMAARDPFAFRVAVLLLLVVGLTIGWANPAERLARAVQPGGSTHLAAVTSVDMWITPPAYTGAPPVFVSHTAPLSPLAVPEGSQAVVHVGGSGRAPTLRLGDDSAAFSALGSGETTGFRAEMVLRQSGTLSVEGARGRTVARWDVTLRPDLPPEIVFSAAPQAIAGARLRLPYQIRDDHGVRALNAVLQRTPEGDAQVFALPAPPRTPTGGGSWQRGAALQDWSAHRWAGTPVTLWLTATDGLGQTAPSDTITLTLPARTFNHPVAQALAEIRKGLNTPGQHARVQAHGALRALMDAPARFGERTSIYLGLSAAANRLLHHDDSMSRLSVQDLLWDMALDLEDGGLSLAAREVERLRRALDAALAEDPNSEKVQQLMNELQSALDRYLAALAKQMKQKGLDTPLDGMDAETIGSDELRDLLERARELARTGNQDAARQLLDEVSRMMEAMRNGLDTAPSRSAQAKARKMMSALRGLAQKQSKLHQDTFRRVQERDQEDARQGRTQPRTDALSGEAERQQSLSDILDRLADQMSEMLGQAPSSLGEASKAMTAARGALEQGHGDAGVQAQAEALQALRDATAATAQALSQQMGNIGLGSARGSATNPNGFGRDPFGRGTGTGGTGGGDIKVPTASERGQVRRLRDELRHRAGQPDRPAFERDYINRLLKQF